MTKNVKTTGETAQDFTKKIERKERRYIKDAQGIINSLKESLKDYSDFDGYADYDGDPDIFLRDEITIIIEFNWFNMELYWLDTDERKEWLFHTIELDEDLGASAPWDADFMSALAYEINGVLDEEVETIKEIAIGD